MFSNSNNNKKKLLLRRKPWPVQIWKGVQLLRGLDQSDVTALNNLSHSFSPNVAQILTNQKWVIDVIDFGTGGVRFFGWNAERNIPWEERIDNQAYKTWQNDLLLDIHLDGDSENQVRMRIRSHVNAFFQHHRGRLTCFNPLAQYQAIMTGFFREHLLSKVGNNGVIDDKLCILSSEEEAKYTNIVVRAAVLTSNIRGQFMGSVEYGKGSTQGYIEGQLVSNDFGIDRMQPLVQEYVTRYGSVPSDDSAVILMLKSIGHDNKQGFIINLGRTPL